MKISIHRETFLDAFGVVSPALPVRSPMVVLQNALLNCYNDSPSLTASNLEQTINCLVPGVTAEDTGSVLLSPRFHQLLKSSSDTTLTLTAEGAQLSVVGERSKHTMPLEDPVLYPATEGFSATSFYRVGADELRRAIKNTVMVCTDNRTNYAMGGVGFRFEGGTLGLTATDGNRLAYSTCEYGVEGEPRTEGQVFVPAQALRLLERMLGDDSEIVDIGVQSPGKDATNYSDSTAKGKTVKALVPLAVAFRSEGSVVWTRLLQGQMHDARQLITYKWNTRVLVQVGALKAAVGEAAVMTSEESRGVRFNFDRTSLRLAAAASDVGASDVGLDLSGDCPQPVSLVLDHRHALTPLCVFPQDAQVTIAMSSEPGVAPVMFECGNGLHLVGTLEIKKKGA